MAGCTQLPCRLDAAAGVRWTETQAGPDQQSIAAGQADTAELPANHGLCLAFSVREPSWIEGHILSEPATGQPGLRYLVSVGDRVVAAPMLKSDLAWCGDGKPVTGLAPRIDSASAAGHVPLEPVYVPAGAHCLWIWAPHDRPSPPVDSVHLTATPASAPDRSVAMISDVHLTANPPKAWMNRKMGNLTAEPFARTLSALQTEVDTLLLGGDLTDGGRWQEFNEFARLVDEFPKPAFACLGNHDISDPEVTNRAVTGPLRRMFPSGTTAYRCDAPAFSLLVLNSQDVPGHATGAARARAGVWSWATSPRSHAALSAAQPQPPILCRIRPAQLGYPFSSG